MTPDAWITLGLLALLVVALASNRIGVDTAMLGVLTAILALGILEPEEAVAGFADPSVIMIAALFVVASGLTETGAMEAIASRVLGRPKSTGGAQIRLMAPVAAMSAVMNNTPIVAMYLPIVHGYARRLRISPSRLYMPLSFAAIMGGACTLIGTSTNIAVNELYLDYFAANAEQLSTVYGIELPSTTKQFWWITVVGLPTAVLGLAFIMVASRWLLPDRSPPDSGQGERKYTLETIVQPSSPMVGKSIEQAGLRQLPGIFLYAIERDNEAGLTEQLPAVGPEEKIFVGDRLIFTGVVESVVDLLKTRGLKPATDQVEKIDAPRSVRTTVEAVVSHTSPLVGKTVRESQFRTRFNAAIIGVHRGGQRIRKKIGDIVLQQGDTLLLSTHAGFVQANRNSQHFYLVSDVQGGVPVRHERAWLSIAIMALLVLLLTVPTAPLFRFFNSLVDDRMFLHLPQDGMPKLTAALLAAVLMVLTRCTTGARARATINWQILLTIAAAIGVGKAMDKTGAAGAIASGIFDLVGGAGPRVLLVATFAMTTLFAQLITNKGSAILMFPVAMSVAMQAGVSPEPFVVTLMAAAACSFMTPVGFVTNLMVYGPGGYRFTDYLRLGGPLTLIALIVCVTIAPMVFPF